MRSAVGALTLIGCPSRIEQRINTVDELVALVGVPLERVANKARPALHDLDRQWLAASPFCLIATADANGHLRCLAEG